MPAASDVGSLPVGGLSVKIPRVRLLLKSGLKFDLVISDQAMPGMSGVELARQTAKL